MAGIEVKLFLYYRDGGVRRFLCEVGMGHPNPAGILDHQRDVGGFRGNLFPAQLCVQWVKIQRVRA